MRHLLSYIISMKSIKFLFILLVVSVFTTCKTIPKGQPFQADLRDETERLMKDFEPRDGIMSLLADAKTGEILASVDLPETGVDRTSTYLYEPGPVFDVFRDSAHLHLPFGTKDSDPALQYVISQFGFTDYPLVTAGQMIEAATGLANHGMKGDVAVISPKAADLALRIMERDKPADMDEYAIARHKDANVVSALAFYPVEEPQYILYIVALHPTK